MEQHYTFCWMSFTPQIAVDYRRCSAITSWGPRASRDYIPQIQGRLFRSDRKASTYAAHSLIQMVLRCDARKTHASELCSSTGLYSYDDHKHLEYLLKWFVAHTRGSALALCAMCNTHVAPLAGFR